MSLSFRKFLDRAFLLLLVLLFGVAAMFLLLLLGYVFVKGGGVVNLEFLTSMPKPVGEEGGGVLNGIVGSLLISFVGLLLAVPVGVLTGVFLAEFPGSRLSKLAALAIDVLQATPSIVIGILVYLWVVVPMRGFSGLSGAVALSLIMLPVVARSTEETVKMLPPSLKEAAYALGVPYHRIVLRVLLPSSFSGIATGVLLSLSRALGETAPILFTAFGSPYLVLNLLKPMAALPLIVFNYAKSPYEVWHQKAWGASLVLLVIVLVLNTTSKWVSNRWKVRF